MYKLFDIIRAVRNIPQPYTVEITWEGDVYFHHAWTRVDAANWMAQYPVDSKAIVYTRSGKWAGISRSGKNINTHA